jgi:23S rRNA (uracil1939-C5)-methyltransferase
LFELDIESLAYGGDAIGRLDDGRVAFVSGACPGDRVAIADLDDRGTFVRAAVAELIHASPHRVSPPCPYFPLCGGCSWQHIDYETQLDAKRRTVVDAIQRIGGFADAESLVSDTLPSPRQYGYRNKIELVADPHAEKLRLGFHEARSERVRSTAVCSCRRRFRVLPKHSAER